MAMYKNIWWYVKQRMCNSWVSNVVPEALLSWIHSLSRKGSTGCERSYKSGYFQQLFSAGHTASHLCLCIQMLSKATGRFVFPKSNSADWKWYCPCIPSQKALPHSTSDASHPTTGKATSVTFAGRSKSPADFATWDVLNRSLQLANLCGQEHNCSPLEWCHLQLLANWRSTCVFHTDLKTITCLGRALSYILVTYPRVVCNCLLCGFRIPTLF